MFPQHVTALNCHHPASLLPLLRTLCNDEQVYWSYELNEQEFMMVNYEKEWSRIGDETNSSGAGK